jgi:hypothetical protein
MRKTMLLFAGLAATVAVWQSAAIVGAVSAGGSSRSDNLSAADKVFSILVAGGVTVGSHALTGTINSYRRLSALAVAY